LIAAALALTLSGCATAPLERPAEDLRAVTPGSVLRSLTIDPAVEARILALDPKHISDDDVRNALAQGPTPRIFAVHGGVYGVYLLMESFGRFLTGMGYPEPMIRDPGDGAYSRSPYEDSAQQAGEIAWYYEHEGVRPMLIGHSQGGMLAIKVLYEFNGSFHQAIPVWNPLTGEPEQRTSIVDPLTGLERPVVGLKVPYVAALATGKLPRFLLGQWAMMGKLRAIPDTVEEFTGFSIEWDMIAGTPPGSEEYHADGTAQVRNVELPAATSHIRMPRTRYLTRNPATRAWIDDYDPAAAQPPLPEGPDIDSANIVHAADIWYSVKKHWCIEAQRLIRARRAASKPGGPE
jgi:pimeloyl-ACP methyl ester carboxylesterase